MGLIPLELGDIRRWNDETWQVAHIEAYSSTRETNNGFSVAVLTPDGVLTQPTLRPGNDERLMYICISSEEFALAWPESTECFPSVGNEAPPLDGWQVERIQEFIGNGRETLYDRVLVCWCSPMSAESGRTAA